MATALRKKSPAYEAGVREGAAMRKRGDKGAKVEIEIKPASEEPETEDPEEEMDADMSRSKTNRKRSAKNAKSTKAPMDGGMYGKKPMDGDCGCGGRKGKASCDGSCGKKMDRNDALTPQEYLAACDLGIQGRSRPYIRARLDAAERLDLRCGKGSISEGEKCHVGAAQKVQQQRASGGGIAGALRRAGERRKQRREFEAPIAAKFKQQQASIKATGKAREAKIAAKYKEQHALLNAKGASRKQKQEADMKAAMLLARSYDNTRKRLRGNDMRTAMRLAKGYDRLNKRRDSVYAAGFTTELDQLAL